ncbi:MAG: cell division protein ZapE, partial [Emcibacter sp.]|nr:cell division protein ZapE [Emcibacter sp.]
MTVFSNDPTVSVILSDPLSRYVQMLEADELRPDDHQRQIMEKLQSLHHDLMDYEVRLSKKQGVVSRLFGKARKVDFPKGLYVHGDVGRGKSMIMDLFFEAAPIQAKRRVHFHSFMLEIHKAMHEWRYMDKAARKEMHGTDEDDPIPPLAAKIAKSSLLLCFDEFQVTDVTDAMILGRLFSNLFDRGVVMVLTSNRTPDDLYAGGLNRELLTPAIEMMKENLEVASLNGPIDYRLERMKGIQVYYHPLSDDATKSLSKAFWQMT